MWHKLSRTNCNYNDNYTPRSAEAFSLSDWRNVQGRTARLPTTPCSLCSLPKQWWVSTVVRTASKYQLAGWCYGLVLHTLVQALTLAARQTFFSRPLQLQRKGTDSFFLCSVLLCKADPIINAVLTSKPAPK
jgi:hypothetical protein